MEGLHAVLHGDALEAGDLDLLVDRLGELLAVDHELVDADAALVAGATARGAALGVGLEDLAAPADGLFHQVLLAALGLEGHLAGLADAAEEALGTDADQGGGDVERLDAHFADTGDGGGRVVGVQGRDEQVARERGLDGDAGGFLVTDFADEDDVGVHTQIAAQRPGEGEADGPAHLHLVDAGERVLDGILGGLDVDVGGVHLAERGIQGHRLARAGGAAMEDHAVGLADALAVLGKVFVGETEHGQRQGGLLLVQDTHDHLLAVLHRPGSDAKVDVHVLLRVALEDNASVLRQPALRDVQVAHDLEAGDEGVGRLLGQPQFFLAQAVDAVADEQLLLHRLDVDVRRALDVGILDDAVGHLDDGRGILALHVGGAHLDRLLVDAVGLAHLLHRGADVHVVGAGLALLEEFLDQRLEQRGGDDADLFDTQLGGLGEGLALGVVERVGHQHGDRLFPAALVREDALAADHRVADGRDQLFVDLDLLDLGDEGQVGQLGDELGGVIRAELVLGIQHALEQGGGVLRDLLEQEQVLVGEFTVRAGRELLVEDLDGANDGVGLERDREHRADLEAGGLGHGGHERGLAVGAAVEGRLGGGDDLADDAGALRQLHGEQLGGGFLQLEFQRRFLGPEGGRVVHVLERDLGALDDVEGHRLGLQRLNDLGGGQLDDGIDVLAAGGGLRDDLD